MDLIKIIHAEHAEDANGETTIIMHISVAIYICILVMLLGVAVTSYIMNYRNNALREENQALKTAERRTCIIHQGGIPVHWRNCLAVNDQYATIEK